MADKRKRKPTPKEIFTPSKKDDKQNKDPQCSICSLLLEKMDQLIASVNAMEKKLKQKAGFLAAFKKRQEKKLSSEEEKNRIF